MKDRQTRRRRSVTVGAFSLERRQLLTSLGHLASTPSAALIDTFPSTHVIHPHTGPAEHDASRRAEHPHVKVVTPSVRRWSWLANTYWYVPPPNLPAVLYNSKTGTLTPDSDQTVYHIAGYKNGYFWGQSATQLGSNPPSDSSMLGSVTPEGRVLLTFTATSDNGSPSITEGFGEMQRKSGQWTMENQMFTAPTETLQIGHWAYMMQTHPGLPSWSSLPSASVSVPTFLNQG
jgi:hypothetical protein